MRLANSHFQFDLRYWTDLEKKVQSKNKTPHVRVKPEKIGYRKSLKVNVYLDGKAKIYLC